MVPVIERWGACSDVASCITSSSNHESTSEEKVTFDNVPSVSEYLERHSIQNYSLEPSVIHVLSIADSSD